MSLALLMSCILTAFWNISEVDDIPKLERLYLTRPIWVANVGREHPINLKGSMDLFGEHIFVSQWWINKTSESERGIKEYYESTSCLKNSFFRKKK